LFYPTQLGRYGSLNVLVQHHARPDWKAAHLVAADGDLQPPTRPNFMDIIAMKGFCATDDGNWTAYRGEFDVLVQKHKARGGRLLNSICPHKIGGVATNVCAHELVPPIEHWTFRLFDLAGRNNLATPSTIVPNNSQLIWNYVIDADGEILVAREDLGFIKHSSIAAGMDVWAAGELGIEDGELRFVNLNSGHYLGKGSGHDPSTEAERAVRVFCSTVFQSYSAHLRPNVLHAGFDCLGR
jgi:hypothetical protein